MPYSLIAAPAGRRRAPSRPPSRPAGRGSPSRSGARPGGPAWSGSGGRRPSRSRSGGGRSGAGRWRTAGRRRRRTGVAPPGGPSTDAGKVPSSCQSAGPAARWRGSPRAPGRRDRAGSLRSSGRCSGETEGTAEGRPRTVSMEGCVHRGAVSIEGRCQCNRRPRSAQPGTRPARSSPYDRPPCPPPPRSSPSPGRGQPDDVDLAVLGAGPAGLAAALVGGPTGPVRGRLRAGTARRVGWRGGCGWAVWPLISAATACIRRWRRRSARSWSDCSAPTCRCGRATAGPGSTTAGSTSRCDPAIWPATCPSSATARVGVDLVAAPLRARRAERGVAPRTFMDVALARVGPTVARGFYAPYAAKVWGVPADELAAEVALRRVGTSTPGALLARVLRGRGAHGPHVPVSPPRLRRGQRSARRRRGRGRRPAGVRRRGRPGDRRAARSGGTAGRCGSPAGTAVRCGPRPSSRRCRRPRCAHWWSRRRLQPCVRRPGRSRAGRWCSCTWWSTEARYTPYDAHYLPGPATPLTRLSEPKNYRDGPDPPDRTVLCAELPAWVGDELWSTDDADLARLAPTPSSTSTCPPPGRSDMRSNAGPRCTRCCGSAGRTPGTRSSGTCAISPLGTGSSASAARASTRTTTPTTPWPWRGRRPPASMPRAASTPALVGRAGTLRRGHVVED